ncbi:sporulation protein YtxC [Natranaerobius trueperi]|uniref:Sporulation protein YtxC n=1 Tax=Natranaerobius trueperi TaxID=759412 RepID=A0A226BUZ1_9FIRM|nr:sporulation protein YtxC [Natranaerobius trueperi]OWZ82858.1 hypothetical protein CDO51_11725 [Natranaerobius trueperi]
MITEITLVTKNYKTQLNNFVSFYATKFKQEINGFLIWKLRSSDSYGFVNKLAKKLAYWYTTEIKRVLLYELSEQKHWHLNKEDYEQIIEKTLNEKYKKNNDLLYWEENRIKEQLEEYLLGSHYLDIEGFLRFRLKWFIEVLDNLLDELINEYLMKKEYEDFLSVLQYFVKDQPCRVGKVHLIYRKEQFELKNELWESFSREYLESIVNEEETGARDEELFMSAVIALTPKEIIIHTEENSITTKKEYDTELDFFEAVETIFSGRVNYCTNCKLCERYIRK